MAENTEEQLYKVVVKKNILFDTEVHRYKSFKMANDIKRIAESYGYKATVTAEK